MSGPGIPRKSLERILDKYAPEGVELIDDAVKADHDHQRSVTAWAERQIESGSVVVGGVREYDDGSFVHHDDLGTPRPYQSKRGDEGTDAVDPDWITEILDELDRYSKVQPWQRDIVARALRQPAHLPLMLTMPRVY